MDLNLGYFCWDSHPVVEGEEYSSLGEKGENGSAGSNTHGSVLQRIYSKSGIYQYIYVPVYRRQFLKLSIWLVSLKKNL